MKLCELSFTLLFSLYLYGVHGRTDYYEREIQPDRPVVEANSVDDEEERHVNDPEVVSLSSSVVNQLNNEKHEDDDPIFLLEIVKAATQVISGNLTVLTLKVSQGEVKETCEIKILDEPWSNRIEIVHSKCGTIPAEHEPHNWNLKESYRGITDDEHKYDSYDRYNPGEKLDVDNEELVRLGTIALDELNKEIIEENYAYYLMEIVRASVEAVSGNMVDLILTLKVSQGPVIKMCQVKIQQQILLNVTKVTESECEDENDKSVFEGSNESHVSNDDHTEDFVNNDYQTITLKEKELEAVNDDDDSVDLNVNDLEVISLSEFFLKKLNFAKKEEDFPFELVKIDKAVLHKHSGKVTLIVEVWQGDTENTCEINLWEDSVNDKFDITHSECGTVPAYNETENINTEEEQIDVDDPEVVRLSVIAMTELNEHNHAGDDPINLLEIVKVSRHVDSGISTTLTLKVSQGHDKKMCYVEISEKYKSDISQVIEFKCETIEKDEMHPVDHQVLDDSKLYVSDEPHYNYNEISDSHTFDEVESVDSLQEEKELDVNNPGVIQLGTLAMVRLNDEKLNEDDPLILEEIIKAATHIPSANSMSLTIKVSQGGTSYVCEMEFLAQPDTEEIKVNHSECGTVPATIKTENGHTEHLINGVEELAVNDPKVIRLSMIALVELYDKYPTNDPINLLEIVKAFRQVVSGMLTFLTLKVSQGYHQKMCDIKILEQPWLNKTKIIQAQCEDLQEKENFWEIQGVNGLNRIIPLSKSVSSW